MGTARANGTRRIRHGDSPGRAIVAVLLSLALLVLAGCSGGGEPAAQGEGATQGGGDGELSGTLRWGIRDYFQAEAEELIAAYQETQPGVEIELELLPTDEQYVQRLLTARLANDLPDVIATADVFVEQFADAGITADLTGLLEESETLSEDYFSQEFLDVYIVKTGEHAGEIHGLPQGADAIVIFYNQAHFDEAGLEYPTDEWTYEDLVETAQQLTISEGGRTSRYGFAETPDWHARYNPMIQAYGGDVLTENGEEANLASEPALQAWRTMLEPMQEGAFVSREVLDTSTATALFTEGRVSMYPGVRAQVPQVRSGLEDPWDVAPNPLVNGERLTGAGSVGVAITTAVRDRALAEDFLAWYFAEDGGMPILTQTYGVVPPIPTLFESDIWRDLEGPPSNNQAFVTAIETAVMAPLLPFDAYSRWDENIRNAVDAVLLNGAPIEETFTQANAAANEILASSEQ